jgi:ferrous iron transport protein B
MRFRNRRNFERGNPRSNEEVISLTSLFEGERGAITNAFGGFGLVRRLAEMGLTPGVEIKLVRKCRFLAAFVVVLIPCAARTVVILGLVGRFVGLQAALALYAFDLILVFILGRIAFKVLPGEPVGLIMEMPSYKKPSLRNITLKTWSRTRDFVFMAFPIIIAGSITIEALSLSGLMNYVVEAASPLISGWLGLPPAAGIPLIFGVLRKELTLILLSELIPLRTLSNIQMIVFALVTMIYIPCLATIAACIREFGWKKALAITVIGIALALFLGGIAYRLLSLVTST